MLIQRASLLDGRIADIRVGEAIEDVGPSLRARRGEAVLDAALGAVIPGLHDHHVHVYSAAAEQNSLRVGPREAHDTGELRRLLAGAAPGADGWIRAIGYHEQVAGPLDRDRLDALAPAVPVRVQHRSGVLWVLNSAGLAAINRPDHPDGILRSADPTWAEALPRRDTDIDSYAERLARYGITGITDATPDLSEPPRGLPQHLHVLRRGRRSCTTTCSIWTAWSPGSANATPGASRSRCTVSPRRNSSSPSRQCGSPECCPVTESSMRRWCPRTA